MNPEVYIDCSKSNSDKDFENERQCLQLKCSSKVLVVSDFQQ